jgi:hypothetical protein
MTLAVKPLYFVRDDQRAQLLAAECRSALRDLGPRAEAGGVQIDGETAIVCLARTASGTGVTISTEEGIREAAQATVAEALAQFQVMKTGGGLKRLNNAYREYRVTTSANGERVMTYAAYTEKYLASIVAVAAEHARITF